MVEVQERLDEFLDVVGRADAAVMDIFRQPHIETAWKADNSPVTEADTAAHEILTKGFGRLFPELPIVSEEGNQAKNRLIVQSAKDFLLIDPLDNTKGFLYDVGSFAICSAVIEDGVPSFAVLSAPDEGELYFGGPSMGSFRVRDGEIEAKPIHVRENSPPIILMGRTSSNPATEEFIRLHFPDGVRESVGSQLKLARIAAGEGDIAPRLGLPFGIWDLATGQAILEGAGGRVTRPDGEPIDYRAPDLMVPDAISSNGARLYY